MKRNIVLLGLFSIFLLILLMFTVMISMPYVTGKRNCKSLANCEFYGEAPVPLPNEVIGATDALTLYSSKSTKSYEPPCFVYFGNNVTYTVTDYGIKLPVGIYNVYVQYLSLDAVNGDSLVDRLIQTEYTGKDAEIIAQRLLDSKTVTFEDNRAMTEYDTVILEPNKNTLRIESAIKGFTAETLKIDRVEILFEKVQM